jgi:hypothetical protein
MWRSPAEHVLGSATKRVNLTLPLLFTTSLVLLDWLVGEKGFFLL